MLLPLIPFLGLSASAVADPVVPPDGLTFSPGDSLASLSPQIIDEVSMRYILESPRAAANWISHFAGLSEIDPELPSQRCWTSLPWSLIDTHTVSIQQLFNSGECQPPMQEPLEQTSRLNFQFYCRDTDLSFWQGKTFGDIAGAKPLRCDSGPGEFRSRTTVFTHGHDLRSNSTFASSTIAWISNSQNEPCQLNFDGGSVMFSDGCIFGSVGRGTMNGQPLPDWFLIKTSHGIRESLRQGRYYSSGTMDVSWYNWKGVVSYSDSQTPPEYRFSNGEVTLSGRFSP